MILQVILRLYNLNWNAEQLKQMMLLADYFVGRYIYSCLKFIFLLSLLPETFQKSLLPSKLTP